MANLERDCRNCAFAHCFSRNKKQKVDCCSSDFMLFDHHVTDTKEAETCDLFLKKGASNEEMKEWYENL